jgi:acetyl-CoA synthetase
METSPIRKDLATFTSLPNLINYESTRETFSWEKTRFLLEGFGRNHINLAYEAVDRHCLRGFGDKIAFRFLRTHENTYDVSFNELRQHSNKFANILRDLGGQKGERVFTLLGRIPELYYCAIGTLKNGCVYSPLFSAFGSEPILARMLPGSASVLVTTPELYTRKVEPIRHQIPSLKEVLLVGDKSHIATIKGVRDLDTLLSEAGTDFEVEQTNAEDFAILHFTSGTTGKPKGAIHVHKAAVVHLITGRYVLDLQDQDKFWCTADPGWVTGTSYGIFAPLLNCVTSIVDESEFDVSRWYSILTNERVTVWYTAPTAIRMLMRAGEEAAKHYSFKHLRLIGSVGEPLNPEAVTWGERVFGRPIHDNWWQTETGGIMIANFPVMDIFPGSMGKPIPGIEAAILERTSQGSLREVAPGQKGELALRSGWPSMFRGYLHETQRYRDSFVGPWYLTGDLALKDELGYFWFVGRADDVIKSAGHLIGPFEVESALLEHEAVAEAAVIGKPDPVMGELVKAFVSLRRGYEASEELKRKILAHSRVRLGVSLAPREITILAELPKTRSGKLMRRLLKSREMGLPEGDLSTLASGA